MVGLANDTCLCKDLSANVPILRVVERSRVLYQKNWA